MRNFFNTLSFRSIACAGLVAFAGMLPATASAGYQSGYPVGYAGSEPSGYSAGPADGYSDGSAHRPAYYYKEVVVYQPRQIPEVHWITKYDHCGKPYQVKVVTYRTIQVPVRQRIKVAY